MCVCVRVVIIGKKEPNEHNANDEDRGMLQQRHRSQTDWTWNGAHKRNDRLSQTIVIFPYSPVH